MSPEDWTPTSTSVLSDALCRATDRFLKADRRCHALEDEISQLRLERGVNRALLKEYEEHIDDLLRAREVVGLPA